MTADQLKMLFSQPLMLLLLMLLGAGGSAVKQLIVARRQGTGGSVLDYFARIETLIMLGAVGASFLTLLFSDTLNIASALSFGYVSNDAADAGTKDGRSAAIAGTGTGTTAPPDTTIKTPAALVLLAGLLGCALWGFFK